MKAKLIPFKSVGNFLLGENIDKYYNDYSFEYKSHDLEIFKTDYYSLKKPEITLFVNDGIIETIGCYEELIYKNKNLIGLTLQEFIKHTNEKYYGKIDELNFEEDSDTSQFVYDFANIGLQVWTKKDIIVTIIVDSE